MFDRSITVRSCLTTILVMLVASCGLNSDYSAGKKAGSEALWSKNMTHCPEFYEDDDGGSVQQVPAGKSAEYIRGYKEGYKQAWDGWNGGCD